MSCPVSSVRLTREVKIAHEPGGEIGQSTPKRRTEAGCHNRRVTLFLPVPEATREAGRLLSELQIPPVLLVGNSHRPRDPGCPEGCVHDSSRLAWHRPSERAGSGSFADSVSNSDQTPEQ
jgi:hypothetical protein